MNGTIGTVTAAGNEGTSANAEDESQLNGPQNSAGAVGTTLEVQTETATPVGPFFASIKEARASVYAGPSAGSTVIGAVFKGERYQIVGRNRGLTWYVLCCLADGNPGWISARVVVREFDLVGAVNLPVSEDLSGVTVERAGPRDDSLDVKPADSVVAFTMSANPAILIAGDIVVLTFRVGNVGASDLTNVAVRTVLPDALKFATLELTGGAFSTENDAGTTAVSLTWPAIAAGDVETAELTARVIAPGGTVIENLASLTADGNVMTNAGVLLGMPPSGLPDFR